MLKSIQSFILTNIKNNQTFNTHDKKIKIVIISIYRYL